MKRAFVLLFLIFSMSFIFAETIDPYRVQTLSGFIDDISYLYVGPFRYDYINKEGFAGINLDYTDTESDYRPLVKPTNTPLTTAGLQMGSFNVLVTYTQSNTIQGVKLTITHDKLRHNTVSNTELEYELAVLYAIGDGTTIGSEITKICLSTEAASNNKIEIVLAQDSKIAAIQNGYLYFRLAKDQMPTVAGQYSSVVTFMMEAL